MEQTQAQRTEKERRDRTRLTEIVAEAQSAAAQLRTLAKSPTATRARTAGKSVAEHLVEIATQLDEITRKARANCPPGSLRMRFPG